MFVCFFKPIVLTDRLFFSFFSPLFQVLDWSQRLENELSVLRSNLEEEQKKQIILIKQVFFFLLGFIGISSLWL